MIVMLQAYVLQWMVPARLLRATSAAGDRRVAAAARGQKLKPAARSTRAPALNPWATSRLMLDERRY